MHIKGKYSWIKHIDFILLDLLALFCSFLISYAFELLLVFLDLKNIHYLNFVFLFTLRDQEDGVL